MLRSKVDKCNVYSLVLAGLKGPTAWQLAGFAGRPKLHNCLSYVLFCGQTITSVPAPGASILGACLMDPTKSGPVVRRLPLEVSACRCFLLEGHKGELDKCCSLTRCSGAVCMCCAPAFPVCNHNSIGSATASVRNDYQKHAEQGILAGEHIVFCLCHRAILDKVQSACALLMSAFADSELHA